MQLVMSVAGLIASKSGLETVVISRSALRISGVLSELNLERERLTTID